MKFNKEITGYRNEIEFAQYLRGKTFGRINPIFQDLIRTIFPYVDFKDEIDCWASDNPTKADIYIKINNTFRGISIKKGMKNSVHVEELKTFLSFLKSFDIDDNSINEMKKYHYADNTDDGTGRNRFSVEEYKTDNQKKIDNINKTINKDKIIEEVVKRCVLQGNNSKTEIAAIIYGVVDDFIWITKEEVKYIMNKRINEYSTGIHFSNLSYQNMARNLNYNPLYEKNRNKIQLKWYNISDDIIEVMATYRNKKDKVGATTSPSKLTTVE